MCGWIRRRKSNTSGTAASCPTCCGRLPVPERSEREADRKDRRVIVLVVVRGGDLESPTESHQQMTVQLESSEYEAWRQKCLLEASILAAAPKRGVDLQFRPQLVHNVVLNGFAHAGCQFEFSFKNAAYHFCLACPATSSWLGPARSARASWQVPRLARHKQGAPPIGAGTSEPATTRSPKLPMWSRAHLSQQLHVRRSYPCG